jgi:aldehyde dehydrogenase (NAD+)
VRQVGLPPGVVNIVTGDGRTGERSSPPDVDKIAFTGSTEVGRLIRGRRPERQEAVARAGRQVPFVVFDDADLDGAVEGVVDAIWFNQGEVCCAGSRLLVQEGVADEVYEKLRERMERLRQGDPADKTVDLGAIIAPVQLDRIRSLVEKGVEEGAQMWQPSWSCPQEGWFYPPTLFTGVSPASTIAQVEIFGPVLAAMTFRTPDEAVELANNTPFGLAASVWTENVNLALHVASRLVAGTVWINSTNLFDAASGFGGYRESGFGREGGREGLWEYLRPEWERQWGVRRRAAERLVAERRASPRPRRRVHPRRTATAAGLPPIDRTAKLYIGGKQVRPDAELLAPGPRSRTVRVLGEVGRGNRKDVRDAVEAARSAASWLAAPPAHLRAQILYYLAENLAARGDELDPRASPT